MRPKRMSKDGANSFFIGENGARRSRDSDGAQRKKPPILNFQFLIIKLSSSGCFVGRTKLVSTSAFFLSLPQGKFKRKAKMAKKGCKLFSFLLSFRQDGDQALYANLRTFAFLCTSSIRMQKEKSILEDGRNAVLFSKLDVQLESTIGEAEKTSRTELKTVWWLVLLGVETFHDSLCDLETRIRSVVLSRGKVRCLVIYCLRGMQNTRASMGRRNRE